MANEIVTVIEYCDPAMVQGTDKCTQRLQKFKKRVMLCQAGRTKEEARDDINRIPVGSLFFQVQRGGYAGRVWCAQSPVCMRCDWLCVGVCRLNVHGCVYVRGVAEVQ